MQINIGCALHTVNNTRDVDSVESGSTDVYVECRTILIDIINDFYNTCRIDHLDGQNIERIVVLL